MAKPILEDKPYTGPVTYKTSVYTDLLREMKPGQSFVVDIKEAASVRNVTYKKEFAEHHYKSVRENETLMRFYRIS